MKPGIHLNSQNYFETIINLPVRLKCEIYTDQRHVSFVVIFVVDRFLIIRFVLNCYGNSFVDIRSWEIVCWLNRIFCLSKNFFCKFIHYNDLIVDEMHRFYQTIISLLKYNLHVFLAINENSIDGSVWNCKTIVQTDGTADKCRGPDFTV